MAVILQLDISVGMPADDIRDAVFNNLTFIVLLLRNKCICIFFTLYCIVKYCIVLSRHNIVYFYIVFLCVFCIYVANKRLH